MEIKFDRGSVEASGLGQSTRLGVKQSAAIYHIMSSGIYTNKPGAIIRELSCNAYDSHIASGRSDIPIRIKAPTRLDPTLIIEDFGLGLDPDTIGDTALTYFGSSKQKTNEIGGFGVGAKSPLCYADQFTMITRWNGVEAYFTVFWNADGEPDFTELGRVATTERNGVQVQMAVKVQDIKSFTDEIAIQCRWMAPHPAVEGYDVQWDEFEMITAPSGKWGVELDRNSDISATSSIRALIGPVSYAVSLHEVQYYLINNHAVELARIFDRSTKEPELAAEQIVTALITGESYRYRSLVNSGLRLLFEVNDGVGIQVSREALSYDERTISIIGERIMQVIRDIHRYTYGVIVSVGDNMTDRAMMVKWLTDLDYHPQVKSAVRRGNVFSENSIVELLNGKESKISKFNKVMMNQARGIYGKVGSTDRLRTLDGTLTYRPTLEALHSLGSTLNVAYGVNNWTIQITSPNDQYRKMDLLNSQLLGDKDAFARKLNFVATHPRVQDTHWGYTEPVRNYAFRDQAQLDANVRSDWDEDDKKWKKIGWDDIKTVQFSTHDRLQVVIKDTRAEFIKQVQRVMHTQSYPTFGLRVVVDEYTAKRQELTGLTESELQSAVAIAVGLTESKLNTQEEVLTPASILRTNTLSVPSVSKGPVAKVCERLYQFTGFIMEHNWRSERYARRRTFSPTTWDKLGPTLGPEVWSGKRDVVYVVTHNSSPISLNYEQVMELYPKSKQEGGWGSVLVGVTPQSVFYIDMLMDVCQHTKVIDDNTILVGIPATMIHQIPEEVVDNWKFLFDLAEKQYASAGFEDLGALDALNRAAYPEHRPGNGLLRWLLTPSTSTMVECPTLAALQKSLITARNKLSADTTNKSCMPTLQRKYAQSELNRFVTLVGTITSPKKADIDPNTLIKQWNDVEQLGYFKHFDWASSNSYYDPRHPGAGSTNTIAAIQPMDHNDVIEIGKRLAAWHRYISSQTI